MFKYAIRLLGSFGAICLSALLSPAGASPTLPDAVSYEYFGLNFAVNIQTSTGVGTLDYTGQPGCGGICTATTQLGSDPSVSATVNEVVYQNTSGGGVLASLGYYVEYLNAAGTYTVNLNAVDSLSAPDGARISAYLGIGLAGSNTTSLNNFSGTKTLEEADCVNGCPAPGFVITPGPFVADHQIPMDANTLYYIEMDLAFNPGPSGVQINGSIDPMFSTDALGGQFIYSPGVFDASSAVPEPSTWAMLLIGFAGLGFVGHRQARRRTLTA